MLPQLIEIDIDLLKRRPFQPRQTFDEKKLMSLASSITTSGLLQPIVARKVGSQYEIVAGERRWRACQRAALTSIPVLVRQFTDKQSAISAISENTERENLNLMEMAHAFTRLSEQFGKTHKDIGELYGVHEKNVTHILRLLKLDQVILTYIEGDRLTLGHAKVILSAPEASQVSLAHQTTKNGWSVRRLEKEVKKALFSPTKISSAKDPDVVRLENELGASVGLPTNIQYTATGSGTITFSFSSLDEFEGLIQKIKPYS